MYEVRGFGFRVGNAPLTGGFISRLRRGSILAMTVRSMNSRVVESSLVPKARETRRDVAIVVLQQ